MSLRLRRAVVLAAGISVALSTGVGAPVQAAEADRAPARAGAAWLSGELTRGLVQNEEFEFADYGLSIDAALGLAEVGRTAVVNRIAKAVAANVASYTTGADFGTSDVYAGATAKAAVLAVVADRKPTSFGGVDLIAQLEGRVGTSGRIADKSEFGDFSNSVGQSFAAWALSAASSAKAKAAVSYLLAQQCRDGYFRLGFTEDPTATDQTCAGAPAADRAPDTDATAIATLALLEVKTTKKVAKAIKRSTAWLVETQRINGGFGGGTTTSKPNTNSAGLAGWVLAELGRDEQAADAAAYVRRHQAVSVGGCAGKLGRVAGAIAYDAKALRVGVADGITDSTSDQWRRATAQALPILTMAPAAIGRLAVTGRTASEQVRFTLTGVAAGEQVCVTGPGVTKAVFGTGDLTRFALGAPKTGAATATYTVVNAEGESAKVVVDLQ